MAQRSAGILLHRSLSGRGREVLLIHPGGPYWVRKDDGAWSIPKGLCEPYEDPGSAALREFKEETGFAPAGPLVPLGEFRLPGGKQLVAWAAEGDWDPRLLRSNHFNLEWPPGSGTMRSFPEADRAGWFDLAEAARKLNRGQVPLLHALGQILGS